MIATLYIDVIASFYKYGRGMKSLLSAVAATSFFLISGQAPVEAAGKSAIPKALSTEKKTGPVGIGSLKLGMSKPEVEALKDGDAHVVSRLHRLFNKKSESIPGVDRYVSKLVLPISSEPVSLSLTFKDDLLIGISVFSRAQNSVITDFSNEVLANYGEGVASDSTHLNPCGALNGESISAKSGDISKVWTQKSAGNSTIQTTFRRAHMGVVA